MGRDDSPTKSPGHNSFGVRTRSAGSLTTSSFFSSARWCKPRSTCFRLVCQRFANSVLLSTMTTLMTVHAMFGDDLRLLSTQKHSDLIFDTITIVCMATFSFEIFVSCFGKPGYLFGFFFVLDIISTASMVLDITSIAETLFGDSISNDGLGSGGDAGRGSGNSAQAARAARMSRVGTKAGRVVRLMRLVRLIRLVKFYKAKAGAYSKEGPDASGPGEAWDDDDDDAALEKESAVSKKLSEMTTRRVIMLVLIIMMALPFFQPSMYNEKMIASAQYGANVLYRGLSDDMSTFRPDDGETQRSRYLSSNERAKYVDDFLMYIYYHNPLCDQNEVPGAATASPLSSFAKLYWLGVAKPNASATNYFLPRFYGRGEYDVNARWNGKYWRYYQCNLTADPLQLLDVGWTETNVCLRGFARGVSLVQQRESILSCPEGLRFQERIVVYPTAVTPQQWDDFYIIFVFDRRSGSQMEAMLNIAQTFFICFLLGFGAMTFSNDANKLVLAPIERMISKLERIRANPLVAMTIGEEERHKEEVAALRKNRFTFRGDEEGATEEFQNVAADRFITRMMRKFGIIGARPAQAPEPMETVVLEKTIIKIGSLLALGFGEAGAEIIGQNMTGAENAALNAMIPGRRVEAIFAFCNIRNFIDATEVLQDQVMVFVNRIASVVHSCVNEYFGSPNNNVGDAFLLAWRLSSHPSKKQERLADMAITSIIHIIAQVNKSPLLAEYRSHPKLVKRLPNYRVRMGVGLHSGWAIEGAIGSEFKIDASYLSPNVNVAVRLEAVTKQYGCLVLLSDALVCLMSENVAEECRLIDHVKLPLATEAFKLFTLDLDDLALEVDPKLGVIQSKHGKYRHRIERQRRKNDRWNDAFDMHTLFEKDPDILTMRAKFSVEFFCRFSMAFLNYEAGEWAVAKDRLEATRFLLATEDGPSSALLRFMRPYDFQAPQSWPGYRILTDV